MRIKSRLHQVFYIALVLLSGAVATMAQVPQLLNYQGRIAVNGTNFTGTGQFKFALISAGTNASVQATASGIVSYGFLVHITVNNGGSGYSTPPAVTVTDSTGTGATANAQISGGVVTNVVMTSNGSGYSTLPTVTIAAPPQQNVSTSFWSNDGTSNAGGQPATSVPLSVTKGLYSVLLGDTSLPNMATLPANVFANPGVWLRVWFNDGITGFQQLTPDQRLAAVGYAILAGTVPDGSITAGKIAAGAVGSTQLAPNLTLPGTLTVSNLVVGGLALTGPSNFQMPGGTNIQAQAGGFIYITNAYGNILLPTNANVGDTINIRLAASYGNHTILQNTGQRIVKWNTISGLNVPIVCSADGTRLLANENASDGFFISTNSAINCKLQTIFGNMPSSFNGFGPFQISSDGSHIIARGYFQNYQGSFISSDYGQTWVLNTNLYLPGNNVSGFACSSNGTKVVAIGSSEGIYTSVDSGSNWTLRASAPTNAYWQSVASSADGTKLVAGCAWNWGNGGVGGIYTSANSGQTWTLQTSVQITNASWNSLSSSSDGTKLVAIYQNQNNGTNGIYSSINSGQTWNLTTAPTTTYWQSVVSSADGTKLVAGCYWDGAAGIYTSTDSGQTWWPQNSGLPNGQDCDSVASSADGSKLYDYSSGGKIYSSIDSGNTWTPITTFPTFPTSTLDAVSSLGTSGGATFNSLFNNQLTFVYLGNGIFAIADQNWLNGY
jgi:hypothetical protein